MNAPNHKAVWRWATLLSIVTAMLGGGCQTTPRETPTPISYAPSGTPGAAQGDGQRAATMMNEARQKAAKP